MPDQAAKIAAVVIGRNEGARLIACLTSLQGEVDRIVYVDSGSTDGSAEAAADLGAEVVALDMSQPFTAARARNAGFSALGCPMPDYVQFVDGDCIVSAGWISAGLHEMTTRKDLVLVTGWRSEINPDASVYNAMCDVEWHRPAGEIEACGGDMLIRADAFADLGGMNPEVIAAEDDELCLRLRQAGGVLWRLPVDMTRHDADMTRFDQWWRRALRAGHGFAQVGHLHPGYFVRERKRAWVYGCFLPILALTGLLISGWLVLAVFLVYLLSYLRTAFGLVLRERLRPREAAHHSVFLTLSKLPNFLGMLMFHARRMSGRAMRIIEYK